MDLLRGAGSALGQIGVASASLGVGLEKTSKQVAPVVRDLAAKARQQISLREPAHPTSTGPFLKGIDQQIMRERPIGTPQVIDKQDAISGRQENDLGRYVKEAMRAMPIGTDTSIEPTVTVVPRTQFHAQISAAGGDPISPAGTVGRNSILVSDELFDMPPKERRAVVFHETFHALRHYDRQNRRLVPPEVEEREAMNFEDQLEPKGARAARARFAAIAQQRGATGMIGPHPIFGR